MKVLLTLFALILAVGCATTYQTSRDPASKTNSESEFEQSQFLKNLRDKNTIYDRVR